MHLIVGLWRWILPWWRWLLVIAGLLMWIIRWIIRWIVWWILALVHSIVLSCGSCHQNEKKKVTSVHFKCPKIRQGKHALRNGIALKTAESTKDVAWLTSNLDWSSVQAFSIQDVNYKVLVVLQDPRNRVKLFQDHGKSGRKPFCGI